MNLTGTEITITHRQTSPKPPTFRKGATVAFEVQGFVRVGTFVRRFSPSRNAGVHYEITMANGGTARILANGPVGRTVTVQP